MIKPYKMRTKFRCELLCRWRPLFQHYERRIRTLSRNDGRAGKSWEMDMHVQKSLHLSMQPRTCQVNAGGSFTKF